MEADHISSSPHESADSRGDRKSIAKDKIKAARERRERGADRAFGNRVAQTECSALIKATDASAKLDSNVHRTFSVQKLVPSFRGPQIITKKRIDDTRNTK